MIMNMSDNSADVKELKHTMGYSAVVRKNLLENTTSSITAQNITYTVNDDKSVTANGTTSSNTNSVLSMGPNLKLPNGEYILSGCPEGGSTSKYYLEGIMNNNASIKDMGSGVKFVIDDNTKIKYVRIFIYAANTVSNLTFYPMIRRADITDDTYETYIEGKDDVDTRLNNMLEWKLVGSVTGRTELTLPSNFKELYVKVESTYSSHTPTHSSYGICQGVIAKNILSSTKQYINLSHIDGRCEVCASLSTLSLNMWYIGTSNMFDGGATNLKTTVYYR